MSIENFWLPKEEKNRRLSEEVNDVDETISNPESVYKHEKVPHSLTHTHDLMVREPYLVDEVYQWYSGAISRRDREPLPEDRFHSHFFGEMSTDPTYAFGEREKGYLLGFLKYGVFTPTHFAPKTMRGGYDLVKSLGESKDVPAVMSITPDLTETVSKLPSWTKVDLSFLSTFREELQQKDVVYNSHPDVRNLMMGLVAEYLDENKERDASE